MGLKEKKLLSLTLTALLSKDKAYLPGSEENQKLNTPRAFFLQQSKAVTHRVSRRKLRV